VQKALEADKTFAAAQKLQHELIRKTIREEKEPEGPRTLEPDKDVPEKRALTKTERREYAILILLYQGHIKKEEYEDAVKCIDIIYKRWPRTKADSSLSKLRAAALSKARNTAKQK